ncbi:MAG: hypothetical protein IJZ29_00460 [Clostridia bacterium]|nr:hypothetical protein [Clostridia bacterium]
MGMKESGKGQGDKKQNKIVNCSVCGCSVKVSSDLINECNNCGWRFELNQMDYEKDFKISYPMLVPVSRAREQYKKGLPFKATFEDFVNGLRFYSEMTLKYENKDYGVFLYSKEEIENFEDIDGVVEFFQDKVPESLQRFSSIKDFEEKAKINDKLLKDIWDEITFAGFMFCG